MDTQGLQHQFNYTDTAQEFANYLWRLARNQYAKFLAREISWAETYPHAEVFRGRDGAPCLVKYMSSRNITFIDPADGQEREYSEPVQGITFELDPLPNGHTRVTAQCHNQAFEGWYSYLLGLFGVQTEAEPISSKSNADNPKPKKQRGMKVGTDARVREMHHLLKKGLSQRQAKRQSHCDPYTYYQYCLTVTGEEPIAPYR
jgi:hypothetical protein